MYWEHTWTPSLHARGAKAALTPTPTPIPDPYPAPTATPSASSEGIFTRFVAFLNDLFEVQPVYAAVTEAPATVTAPVGEVFVHVL